MEIFEKQEKRIQALLSEVRTIKSFATRVEASLLELQGGVGTARRVQSRTEQKKEEIRQKARLRFK